MTSVLAAVLTFLAAGCVLVLEIAAGRLLAPYVGVSLTTYTGIIGVILAGIAVGAWSGGRSADRYGPLPLIGPTFVLGGLAAMASVPVVGWVGDAGVGNDIWAIVVLSALGFFVPAAILSAVAPMIVRATISDIATSGALVGRLSAIGTVGAITGTFLTGFVLLGLVPTRALILGTGGLLVLIGLVVTWRLGGHRIGTTALAVAGALVLGSTALAVPNPCDRESAYYCIAIEVDPTDPDLRSLILDRLHHARVDVGDPTHLEFGYLRRFADAAEPVLEAVDGVAALHVGGGGFTFPRYLEAVEPGSRQTVLELDPVILETAREHLGFEPDDATSVITGDAGLSIRAQPSDAFDLVAGDAFGGLSVPWHLTTREFVAQIDRVLRPDGRYVMNLIDGPALRFVRAEAATLRETFAHVAVVAFPAAFEGAAGGNVVLVASHAPIDTADLLARIEARGEAGTTRVLSTTAELEAFTAGAPVLTDDFAPVDQLIGR